MKPSRTGNRECFVGNYNTGNFNIEHNGSGTSGLVRGYYNNGPNLYTDYTIVADETATICFSSTYASRTLYKNGGDASYTHNGNATGALTGDRPTIIGGENNRTTMAFRGSYYAFRLYNRPLTAVEARINDNVDRMRFEGTDPETLTWPNGYRWNAGAACVEYRVDLSSDDETLGTVSCTVDGVETNLFPIWVKESAELVVTATPASSAQRFVGWTDGSGVLSAQERTRSRIVKSGGTFDLVASFRTPTTWNVPGDFVDPAAALADPRVQEFDVISLAAGTYTFEPVVDDSTHYTNCASVRKRVAVVGATGNRDDVVIDCQSRGGFLLDDPGARLADLTISNFCRVASGPALRVNQGSVSNVCINGIGGGCANVSQYNACYFGEGALIEECDFYKLTNTGWGSANTVSAAGATFRRCTFRNASNNCTSFYITAGGNGTRGRVEDCVFHNNNSYYYSAIRASGTDVVRCRVYGNSATGQMASNSAIVSLVSNSSMSYCVVTNNSISSNFNGSNPSVIAVGAGSSTYVTNCLVAHNTSGYAAAFGSTGSGAKLYLVNCTVANNASTKGVSGAFFGNGASGKVNEVHLVDSIVRFNTAKGVEQDFDPDADFVAYYCDGSDFIDITPADGSGNFDYDPLFADAAHGDYTLADGSPCIDAAVEVGLTDDLLGNPRPRNGLGGEQVLPDVGCYEAPETEVTLEVKLYYLGVDRVSSPYSASLKVVTVGKRQHGLVFRWTAHRHCGGEVYDTVFNGTTKEHVFENLEPGSYSFSVRVENDLESADYAEDSVGEVVAVCTPVAYVSKIGSDEWPYDSPATAARRLADAIAIAGNEVRVAAGEYAFDHQTDPVTGYSVLGVIPAGLKVYGTDNPRDCVLDCGGTGGVVARGDGALVAGFKFVNFVKTAETSPALFCDARAVASNVVFESDGEAIRKANTIHIKDLSALVDSEVAGVCPNVQSEGYRVVYLDGGNMRRVRIRDCRSKMAIVSAQVSTAGNPVLVEDCEFSDCINAANGFMEVKGDSVVRRTEFLRLTCPGQLLNVVPPSTVENCGFRNCTCSCVVGVNTQWGSDWLTMRNCMVLDNVTAGYPAVANQTVTSRIRMYNCTIARNDATGNACAGGIGSTYSVWNSGYTSTQSIYNSVIYGNTTNGLPCDVYTGSHTGIVVNVYTNCFREAEETNISGSYYRGAGNFSDNPKVCRSGRLGTGSSCIGTGAVFDWAENSTDYAGRPRISEGRNGRRSICLGAVESVNFGTMLILR